MQMMIEARLAEPEVLLDQDLLITKVAYPGTAVLFVGPHHEIALLTGLAECLALNATLLAPALRMRCDLLLKEPPRRLAKDVVLRLEDQSTHVCPLGRIPRCNRVEPLASFGACDQFPRGLEARPKTRGKAL